ncbi:hypothetical protein ACSV5G_10705 [Agrobacterium cavarae]|uniref:hypothetical protein n=1 Tax=Agrobacterium cavarae TaxID=2528239 RepID=UPI003FD19462
MDMNVELEQLRIKSHSLHETIRDIDAEVERAMHVAAGGTDDVGRAISIVAERHNTQLGLMFDLGKVTAQIEDLENRIREQDEVVREQHASHEWHNDVPLAQEDRLDWLRPTLEERDIDPAQDDRHPHYDGEERMLEEMQREDRQPEDYLDWWKR